MTLPALKPDASLGRYQIVAEIAQGAMGVVYRARDPLIDRVVAIKTVGLGLSNAETEAYERRFFREAKSAGRLNHPNIVTIYDVGKSGDIAYIAMEFCDGKSLRDILDSGVVLPPERVADIGAQIAEGLAYAHRHQVVHRDVKPANIMVLDNGRVKITDFGIALLPTGTRTLAGTTFGSPRYTSPEQIVGRVVDGRSDIFSLGAVVYEMLTGLTAFTGGDLNSILTQVLNDPTPAPSSHNRSLPRAFDHIVGKALAKDPADRYQDAQQMADDLRNYSSLELSTPGPAPLPPLEHPTVIGVAPPTLAGNDEPMPPPLFDVPAGALLRPRWWERRPLLAVGLPVAILAVAALIWALVPQQRAPARPPPAAIVAGGDIARPDPGTTSAPASPVATDPAHAERAAPPPAATPAAPVIAPQAPVPASNPTASGAPQASGTGGSGAATPAAVTSGGATPVTPASSSPAEAQATMAKPAVPAAKPAGRVTFAVTPWGEIHVDGRLRGVAPPLQELRVAPGKHVIEIRNPTFPAHRETIEVPPDGVVRIRHKFP